MSVVASISIFPLGKTDHLGPYVARALNVIEQNGLDYRLGPMGTVLEGEFDQVLEVARQCMAEMEKDCDRIYMTLTVDNRKGLAGRIDGKVASVEKARHSAG